MTQNGRQSINDRAKELAQGDRLSETKRFIRVAGYYIAIPLWLSCSILDFFCYSEKIALFGAIGVFSALLTIWILGRRGTELGLHSGLTSREACHF